MKKLLITPRRPGKSVFTPLGQRVFGMAQIAQGVATVLVGSRAPSWTLRTAAWGAREAGRMHRSDPIAQRHTRGDSGYQA